jgi:hypothetical protein
MIEKSYHLKSNELVSHSWYYLSGFIPLLTTLAMWVNHFRMILYISLGCLWFTMMITGEKYFNELHGLLISYFDLR